MHIGIFGANGFVGQHLVRQALADGHTVLAVSNQPTWEGESAPGITYQSCDLTAVEATEQLDLAGCQAIINLAGFAAIGGSFNNPHEYERVNVAVHQNVWNAAKKQKVTPRILAISSGAVYEPNQPMPLGEDAAVVAAGHGSPYAHSKLAMERAAEEYNKAGGDCIVVRPFNHVGPGQKPGFLVPDLAEQILKQDKLRVGNLHTKRDYTDVRDVVRAYLALATAPKLAHKLYNVCSGKSAAGQEILTTLTIALGKPDIPYEVDPSRIRPDDPTDIIGNSTRLQQEVNWKPHIPLEQTIKDFANWRMHHG